MGLLTRRKDKPASETPQERTTPTMTRPIISLTPEQRKAAWEKAAEAKAAKKELLDNVRERRVRASALLSADYADNDRVQKLQVSTLLRATPGVNAHRVGDIMGEIGIDESRRIKGLGDRQREHLLTFLNGR